MKERAKDERAKDRHCERAKDEGQRRAKDRHCNLVSPIPSLDRQRTDKGQALQNEEKGTERITGPGHPSK